MGLVGFNFGFLFASQRHRELGVGVGALKKELGVRDLALTQILFIVGLTWIGVAGKLGPSHVVFWLTAIALFYVPSAIVVIYLNTLTPLTFVWQFTGSRSWNPDNAAVSIGMGVGLQSAGFIDNVGWGISYVDAPPSFGDFAGVLSSPFGVSAAGVGFSNVLPVGDWNGLGSRQVSSTMQWALTDTTGSFSLDVNGGMVGDVLGSNTLTLIGLTVPVGTVLANSGAFLLLDNGVRLRITAVPEPQAWALLAVGLALVGFRRRAMGAPQG